MIGYHGTNGQAALHVGLCLTSDGIAAAHYAKNNDGQTVTEIDVDLTGLTVEEVDYDYDGCEPVLDGVTADVAEYTDCDEIGLTHRTWMLLTPAALAAARVVATHTLEEAEEL